MCQEKKEEEDLPAMKMALTHRYNDSKTTLKSTEEDRFQPSILTVRGSTERKQQENKNGYKTIVLND